MPLWDDCKDLLNPNNVRKPSCYRRLKAFSKDFPFENRIVSIDLDCVIVGNIDDILLRQEDFICLKGTARKTAYNGGLWSLKVGSRPQVWEQFNPKTSPNLIKSNDIIGSDQGWISYVLGKNESVYSIEDGVYCFRTDLNGKLKLSDNAKIIMFQGGKDPWDIDIKKKYYWVNQHYKLDNEIFDPEISKFPQLNCITFLWGDGLYNADYVNRLFNGIDRHLSYPHKNICFTNIPKGIRKGIEIKPLTNEWMYKNLKKMIQYDPENGLSGRVLSFDLDNVIVGSLDKFAENRNDFVICEGVYKKRKGKCAGNFMAFDAGYGKYIWEELIKDYEYYKEITGGSERFLYDKLIRKMSFWPEGIVSYKQHVLKDKVKNWDKVSIIWHHGKMKPHEVKDKIVVDNWK
jgi:hypothetical protein